MAERIDGIVLEVDAPDLSSDVGVLRLLKDVQIVMDASRQYLVGGGGQLSQEAVDILEDQFNVDIPYIAESQRRAGYYIDGGEGTWPIEVTATLSETPVDGEYLQMGDSSDPSVLTETSATGASPGDQADVLHHWLTQSKSDSASPILAHVGNWHDGTYVGSGEPGLFGEPLPVTISEGPRFTDTSEESSSIEVVFTCEVVAAADAAIDAAARTKRGT